MSWNIPKQNNAHIQELAFECVNKCTKSEISALPNHRFNNKDIEELMFKCLKRNQGK